MSQIKPKARQREIVQQDFGNEILIYDLSANKAFALNETSSMVWQYCDGKNSIAQIAEKMTLELKEFVSEDLVWLALEKLIEEGLIEEETNFVSAFDKSSRREIIRRVGMASLVAFPVIASLIAPTSVYAFSCSDPNNNLFLNGVGCTCQSNNDCNSICCGVLFTCVTNLSAPNGNACRGNCECAENCCGLGFFCAAVDSVAVGGACRVNCECVGAATCVAGVCT